MRTNDLIAMGFANLWRRKTRTLLTVLGVVIGAASIVLMLSLGLGQQREFSRNLDMFGDIKTITLSSGGGMYGMYGGMGEESTKQGTKGTKKPRLDDAAIKMLSEMPEVDVVIEYLNMSAYMTVGKYQGNMQIQGIDLAKIDKLKINVESGEMLVPGDSKMIIAGKEMANNFYDPKGNMSGRWERPQIDLLNSSFKTNVDSAVDSKGNKKRYIPMTVKGVIGGFGEHSYSAYMDIKEVKKMIIDDFKKYPPQDQKERRNKEKELKDMQYSTLKVVCKKLEQVEPLQQKLKDMGYSADSPIQFINEQKKSMRTQQLVLGGIGAVSLLVAAIGITNTMVMSIYERTREIGVMKVLGAEVFDILKLFLFEASMIGLLGGALGAGISYAGSMVINHFYSQAMAGQIAEAAKYGHVMTPEISYIPVWLVLAAMFFSSLIGVISGLVPAIKATKLSALEAIKTNG